MTRVDFYILPSTDPSACLDFACKLTEKAWRMGHRIYLHCSDASQRDNLDTRMWCFKGESFLPHGYAESEPEGLVVLGLGDNCGISHDLLVNLDLKSPAFFKDFARVAEVVVENPGISQAARERFRLYRKQGHSIHHHQIQRL